MVGTISVYSKVKSSVHGVGLQFGQGYNLKFIFSYRLWLEFTIPIRVLSNRGRNKVVCNF